MIQVTDRRRFDSKGNERTPDGTKKCKVCDGRGSVPMTDMDRALRARQYRADLDGVSIPSEKACQSCQGAGYK